MISVAIGSSVTGESAVEEGGGGGMRLLVSAGFCDADFSGDFNKRKPAMSVINATRIRIFRDMVKGIPDSRMSL